MGFLLQPPGKRKNLSQGENAVQMGVGLWGRAMVLTSARLRRQRASARLRRQRVKEDTSSRSMKLPEAIATPVTLAPQQVSNEGFSEL